jgi:NAD(P)-dependent dehydrogenase (short-subunit alcohol dehydrogenase family)
VGVMAGRGAVVTGAGRGMGRAIAQRLHAEGARVVAVDVEPAGLAELDAGAGLQTVAADLADPAGRARVMDAALADRVDFLVNAAAILGPRPFWEVTEDHFRRVFAVNLESAWFLSLGLGQRLEEGGAIVNFSSPSARVASTLEAAVYAATKTAIQSMTRSFAHALAPRRIRVNAISPGIIDTPMQHEALDAMAAVRRVPREELDAQRRTSVPLGRWGTPDEIAGVVTWLLSDTAGYITGQCLYVDGGLIMSA